MRKFFFQYYQTLISKREDTQDNLRKTARNIKWLFIDRFSRLVLGLVVGVLIARQLGPQKYGLLSYSMTFSALFSVLANLGLDSIVVESIIKCPADEAEITTTAFTLKLASGIFSTIVAIVIFRQIRPDDYFTQRLIALTCISFILQSTDIFNFWFQAKSRFKLISTAQAISAIVINGLRLSVLYVSSSLFALALLTSLEVGASNVFLISIFLKEREKILPFVFSLRWAKILLQKSWPLALSGLTIFIYMKVDQLMIGEIIGNKSVGIYSVAIKLVEVWYFIPSIISSAFLPSIIKEKQRNKVIFLSLLKESFRYSIYSSILITVLMLAISPSIIGTLYGDAYSDSIGVVNIYIWSTTLVYLQITTGNWFISEGLTKAALTRNLLGGLSNILLNIYLIPLMGIQGAAIATIVSFGIVVFSPILFLPRYRKTIPPLMLQALVIR